MLNHGLQFITREVLRAGAQSFRTEHRGLVLRRPRGRGGGPMVPAGGACQESAAFRAWQGPEPRKPGVTGAPSGWSPSVMPPPATSELYSQH